MPVIFLLQLHRSFKIRQARQRRLAALKSKCTYTLCKFQGFPDNIFQGFRGHDPQIPHFPVVHFICIETVGTPHIT